MQKDKKIYGKIFFSNEAKYQEQRRESVNFNFCLCSTRIYEIIPPPLPFEISLIFVRGKGQLFRKFDIRDFEPKMKILKKKIVDFCKGGGQLLGGGNYFVNSGIGKKYNFSLLKSFISFRCIFYISLVARQIILGPKTIFLSKKLFWKKNILHHFASEPKFLHNII